MREEILKLALQHNIQLQTIITTNELGLDFRTAIGEDTHGMMWLLRIPRREDLIYKIQQEQNFLSFLKSKVSFDVPDWKVTTSELVAYPLLIDKPALEVNSLTQEFTWNINLSSYEYSESLAVKLHELHNLTKDAEILGVPIQTSDRIRKQILEEVNLVRTELGLSSQLETQWRDWVEDDTYWPSFCTLVHGDLYAGHTLVNSNNCITGIIDWSEMHIGDPSLDFAGQYIGLGESQLDKTLVVYKKLGGRTWPRMKEHIIQRASAAPLKFAIFALNTKNNDHIEAAKSQLNIEG